jgi:hypothetical protein
MAFITAFIAHAPDADPQEHRCKIETPKYKLFTIVVRNQEQALEAAKELVEKEGVHTILLCPGFSHLDVAGIAEAVGKDVAITVARGDGPGGRITGEIIRREWFS